MSNEQLLEIVKTLAASVAHHDNKIEAHDRQIGELIDLGASLIANGKAQDARIEALIAGAEENKKQWQDLQRQWQAYLNTLPRQ